VKKMTFAGQCNGERYSEQGAVLLLVLWVLLAMSMLALSFSAAIRTEVNAARNTVDQKQAFYLSRAGIEYAAFKIIEAQSAFSQAQQALDQGFEGISPVQSGLVMLELEEGGAEVEIIDETGKININLAPGHLIYNLLITVGVGAGEADIITDSIEDWRDPDDYNRANGAESDYYLSLPEPYRAKNGFLDVPEELLLVRGITPEIYYGRKGLGPSGERVEYYGLQKYLTTFTTINRINVNSAPVAVLAAIPGLDYEAALRIEAMRQGGPITNVTEIMERIPGLPMEATSYLSTFRSSVYTLVSHGRVRDSAVTSRIRTVIRVDQGGRKGYSVLYWNESNIEL
jgi:general secretion pathway protein K